MIGVALKSLRETWIITVVLATALLLMEMLLHLILPQFQTQANEIFLEIPFIRTIVSALLGADVGDTFTAALLQAIVWLHPVVLTIIWAHEIIVCSRIPAGEIDRGTIDILLAQPVSRRAIYLSDSLVALLSGLVVLSMTLLGTRFGVHLWMQDDIPGLGRSAMIAGNLLALYIAVAGVTCLVSSCCSSRGRAVGIVFAIVVGSFLLNFLTQMWQPARPIAFLGVLEYYRPADILRSGRAPVDDVLVLLSIGLVTWTAGLEIFSRRSIATS